MHVLVTADTLGGVWTYARELVTGLARCGVRVTLVSFGEIPNAEQSAWLEGLPNVDFRPTAFRLEWMQDTESDLEASAEFLAGIVREVKPDLLHLNQYYYGALPVDVPRVVVAHSDVISWWLAVHGHEPPDTKWLRWYRKIVARGIQQATALVAPSAWMLTAVHALYGKPREGCVVYNGRSATLFNPHVSKEPYAISVGRIWDSGKQVTLLAQTELPLPVYVVGSEQHPDVALRNAGSLAGRSRSRVHFKGPQNEAQLRQLYSRASMYAATSRYEPFGLAPVEAALSRCAIVANDIPSLREVWGDAACYFAPHDAEDLAAAMSRLHRDPELCAEYANRAYQRALQRFTSERMVAGYMSLYASLVPAGALAA